MLFFLSLLGFFLSVLLLSFNVKKYHSSMYLGFFFLMTSIHVMVKYMVLYSGTPWLISLAYVHFSFLDYLTGPMLYFYVRSLLTDQYRLKPMDYWHFAPMLLFLAAIFPYFLTPWSVKMEYASMIVENPDMMGFLEPTAVHRVLSTRFVFLSRILLMTGYILWSSASLVRYLRGKRDLAVFAGQRFLLKWLTALLGFSLILAISQILLVFQTDALRDTDLFFTLNGIQVFSLIGLTGLLASPFLFPTILYGLPRLPAPPAREESNRQQEFEAGYLESIKRKADACMAEFQPFLKPDFSMVHLAVLIKVPVHHIAYLFREEEKQSFTEYRNTWRVEHAKALIRQGKAKKLTLEAIGMICGFSSRSAFHVAFKKAEGVSPGEYAAGVEG